MIVKEKTNLEDSLGVKNKKITLLCLIKAYALKSTNCT